MKKARLALIIVIIALVIILGRSHQTVAPGTPTAGTIVGCYVARLAKDVYTINIQSQSGQTVSGLISYNNFDKDSSTGTFTGTYTQPLLQGYYSFRSEGMDSVGQVIYKKTADGFVQGFGPVTNDSNKTTFADMNKITYDNSPEFRSAPCAGQ